MTSRLSVTNRAISTMTATYAVVAVHEDRGGEGDGRLVLLLELVPGVQVVGTAGDGLRAVRTAAELSPDVVLMDLRMPLLDRVQATRRIRAARPGPRPPRRADPA
ncbi:response regulator [Nonomuraea phyllanthi]|uniref:response regulator n=1 Tax=Nonomuraea phyllanthi TaxID=2219224 RepID=UPI00186AC775|nr:response regulator [Nonomuraea phyllanthi]